MRYYFDFIFTITKKELKIRYKYAALGFLWVIINPVLQILTLGVVFKFFTRLNIENYYIFLLIGLLPWNFFSESLLQATPSIINNRQLLTKAAFPKSLLILSTILANLFQFLITLGLALVIYLWIGKPESFLLMLLSIVWLVSLTVGLSLCTSAITVWFRDMQFLTKNLISLWFYATPILYSQKNLPQSLQILFAFNPVAGIVELFRSGFLGGYAFSPPLLTTQVSITFTVVLIGILIYKKLEAFFVDQL